MVTTRLMARTLVTDRLSALSDDFLINRILSEISYRDVVRISLLSKRWRVLWKKITFLNFYCQDFEKQKDDKIQVIINNALLHLDAHLRRLNLQVALDDPKIADLNNWVRLAAEKQVQRMALQISYRDPKTGKKLNRSPMAELGDSVFRCENVTALKLSFINLPKIPSNFGVFRSLKTFYYFKNLKVNDATFEEFMDVCPHLQNLGIRGCLRLKNVKIHASNLMYLHLGALRPDISLQMACPRLTEISLMDYGKCQGLKLLLGISAAESVKIITLQNYNTSNAINPGIPSITVLNSFPQLEKLIMHGLCFLEMMSDEIPVAEVSLPNLKRVCAHIGPDKGGQAVTFLGFLLRNSPLNVTRVFFPKPCSRIMRIKLLDLKKEFPKSRLSTATKGWSTEWNEFCQICHTHPEY